MGVGLELVSGTAQVDLGQYLLPTDGSICRLSASMEVMLRKEKHAR
jgi:hypothetical protein